MNSVPKLVSADVLQTAFMSAKNIGTVYEEIHSRLYSQGIIIGTEHAGAVSELMKRIWRATNPRRLQQQEGSPKAAVLRLNELAVTWAIRVILSVEKAPRPARADVAARDPLDPPSVPVRERDFIGRTSSAGPTPLRPVATTSSPARARVQDTDPPARVTGWRPATSAAAGWDTPVPDAPRAVARHTPLPYSTPESDEITGPSEGRRSYCTDVAKLQHLAVDSFPQSRRQHTEHTAHPIPRRNPTPALRDEKHHFVVKSSLRNTTTWPEPTHYRTVVEGFPAFQKLVLVKCDLSPPQFTVTENNNNLYFCEDDDAMICVTIPAGTWEITGLVREVERRMCAAGKYRYRVTVDRTSEKVNIEQVTPVRDSQLHLLFEQTKNNLGKVLGYGTTDCRGRRAYVAETPYLLEVSDTAVLSCDEFPGRSVVISTSDCGKALNEVIWEGNSTIINGLTVSLNDLEGNPYPTGGRDHTLHFCAYATIGGSMESVDLVPQNDGFSDEEEVEL